MKKSKFKPTLTLQQILNQHLNSLPSNNFNPWQWRVLNALNQCKTESLGGHWEACQSCGTTKVHYNSCGNRHCPGCQGANTKRWLLERDYDLFDVPYHHVTFTIPFELRAWFKMNEKELYNLLFKSMWATLLSFSKDKTSKLNAEIGVISILHTWTQKLEYHPHLHCIVPSGGLTASGNWKAKSGKFLFYVPNLSKVFRAKFCEGFKLLYKAKQLKTPKGFNPAEFKTFVNALFDKDWVVNSKPGFSGKASVLEYLGRYTHKIAISNYRLKSLENGCVKFSYRDRKKGDIKRSMKLPTDLFLKRFAQHILPKYFVKIRHYGIFSTRVKKQKLKLIRKALNQPTPPEKDKMTLAQVILETTGVDVTKCTSCKEGKMIVFKVIHPSRGSPRKLMPNKIEYPC
ncbi:IS91 family transposase [Putridiphycobacter roseus]|uniref:IS91 family transposase n=2 Tax=Putridiphycobacter roseus TaxID=2219161 RepID=UPI00131462C1|nr:IS91 family transposase [Putridiphycobacter roseus]